MSTGWHFLGDKVACIDHIPAVSVVVPIYGVEKYLRQCVDSILAQTLQNIEVILVNDGSKDGCPAMIDAYAKQDRRVVAVSQENQGYGKAVNCGIAKARGEFIGLIEADDWIEPTMYEKLYKNAKANNSDVVKCLFYRYDSTVQGNAADTEWVARHQNLREAPDSVFSVAKYPKILCFHASVWAALYRGAFVKQQKMVETKTASYQDFPFMIETMCRAQRITVVKECLIHYRMESGQNSSTLRRDERLLMMPEQCCYGREILKKYRCYDKLKEEFYFHSFLTNRGFYSSIYFKHKRAYFQKLRELFLPLLNDPEFTYKYFTSEQRTFVRHILANRFYSTLIPWKKIRRFLFSARIKPRYVRIQVLGFAFSIGSIMYNRPSIAEIHVRLGWRQW